MMEVTKSLWKGKLSQRMSDQSQTTEKSQGPERVSRVFSPAFSCSVSFSERQ